MATSAATNSIPKTFSNTINNPNKTKEQLYGVPVKFADDLFSGIIKNQINELINSPQIKQLKYADENAIRTFTYEITEILKQIICQHIKDNYKVVIQVITYPKEIEENIVIMSKCLWNYKTDDVLSLEIETDEFKFFILIHGVVA
ncbi:unnamed protein product [Rotaria magnacalcarata]|uniref:Topoisomerase I damage affected protein 2 n=1 Tax=Rotaria magnacalcarata TaxID=392030 RepID=A0A816BUJ9_9BILA|nr:unnamed protein product [Rotaria magnacalcarata]CAF1613010.1 unnamed protein product [Rotaria magnacalcarata]CAF2108632.1 unnamed protein product [Rotaria magnacalcarata]CAF3843501.1 unnamed protein product [Rotaria magnacalcarata]